MVTSHRRTSAPFFHTLGPNLSACIRAQNRLGTAQAQLVLALLQERRQVLPPGGELLRTAWYE